MVTDNPDMLHCSCGGCKDAWARDRGGEQDHNLNRSIAASLPPLAGSCQALDGGRGAAAACSCSHWAVSSTGRQGMPPDPVHMPVYTRHTCKQPGVLQRTSSPAQSDAATTPIRALPCRGPPPAAQRTQLRSARSQDSPRPSPATSAREARRRMSIDVAQLRPTVSFSPSTIIPTASSEAGPGRPRSAGTPFLPERHLSEPQEVQRDSEEGESRATSSPIAMPR